MRLLGSGQQVSTIAKPFRRSSQEFGYDPDALAWFRLVEATGANFGLTPAIIATNKKAWSRFVTTLKGTASPIAGRTNWQQLTQANEGYIQPLMGVSTFNVPALFGASAFTGFVAGDYIPQLGLIGGAGKILRADSRSWSNTPLDDFSAGLYISEAGTSASTSGLWGVTAGGAGMNGRNDGFYRVKSNPFGTGNHDGLVGLAAASRHQSPSFVSTLPGSAPATRTMASDAAFSNGTVSFFDFSSPSSPLTRRASLAFCGRSIDLGVMKSATEALSASIRWLDFTALTALPSARRGAVEEAVNLASLTLGVTPQSVVDALAVGRGFASLLPSDGCLLAASGGSATVQGDPVGAIRSWTEVELASQSNASLRPVSAAAGVYADGAKHMLLGNLSAWAEGESFAVIDADYTATSGTNTNVTGLWQIGANNFATALPYAADTRFYDAFGSGTRITGIINNETVFDKSVYNVQHSANTIIGRWNGTQVLSGAANTNFMSAATLFRGVSANHYRGWVSAFSLNSALYTTAQRTAVQEFCRHYYGVTYPSLSLAALPALPLARRSAVEASAREAAIILDVTPQSIIEALAAGRGFASLLPSDGCLLAASGGAVTVQGDPVGAFRSWTGVELATQGNASLRPVSAAEGLYADGSKFMALGNLSAWVEGSSFVVSAMTGVTGLNGFWSISSNPETINHDHLPFSNGQLYTRFGISSARQNSTLTISPITKKVILDFSQSGGALQARVDGTTYINTSGNTVGFPSDAVMFRATNTTYFYQGTWSALSLNSTLYTMPQRDAVREFCRSYYQVVEPPLNLSALTALPTARRVAVEVTARIAATALGVAPQSVIDALAVGRGLASLLPGDGCLLAASGGALTVQGDPVGAIRSWTGVELATQTNVSLRPVSAAAGVYADGAKWMGLGNLSSWAAAEAFAVTQLNADATTFTRCGFWEIGTGAGASYTPLNNGQVFSSFGVNTRFNNSIGFVSPVTKKIISNHRSTGTQLIVDVGLTNAITAEGVPSFVAEAKILASVTAFYAGNWSALSLNSSLYTAPQRDAVREFCRNYFGVTY